MWDRKELKQRAWDGLKRYYWKAFLVSFILVVIGGSGGGGTGGYNATSNGQSPDQVMGSSGDILLILPFIIGAVIVGVLVVAALRIFVGFPLEVGGRRFFVQAAQGSADLNALGYAFTKSHYMEVIKAMLWRGLFTFLWTLLLIIPGIIKSYAYRMVPYILADNPKIGYRRALELSSQMTDGHKFAMLILDLSFIGWYLLGALVFFVGTLFILPYPNATNAELYLELRKDALENGLSSNEELMLG